MNQISTVTRGAHPFSVVALAIASAALIIAIATFVTVNTILRLFWAAIAAIPFSRPLRFSYSDHTEDVANKSMLLMRLKRNNRIEYRARITRNQTLKTLMTQVTLVLYITEKTRLDYGPQQPTKFINGCVRRGLLITEVIK